jgi:hypothetical protein
MFRKRSENQTTASPKPLCTCWICLNEDASLICWLEAGLLELCQIIDNSSPSPELLEDSTQPLDLLLASHIA